MDFDHTWQSQWNLTISDRYWWISTTADTPDEFWPPLMDFDHCWHFWWILATSDRFWPPLMNFDHTWWILTTADTPDEFWPPLMDSYHLWWFLTTSDEFWPRLMEWILTTPDGFWPPLMDFDNPWWILTTPDELATPHPHDEIWPFLIISNLPWSSPAPKQPKSQIPKYPYTPSLIQWACLLWNKVIWSYFLWIRQSVNPLSPLITISPWSSCTCL